MIRVSRSQFSRGALAHTITTTAKRVAAHSMWAKAAPRSLISASSPYMLNSNHTVDGKIDATDAMFYKPDEVV